MGRGLMRGNGDEQPQKSSCLGNFVCPTTYDCNVTLPSNAPESLSQTQFSLGENRFCLVRGDNYNWCSKDSVDLVLTDPPFNIARDTNFHTYEKNTINSYRFDKDKGWDSHSPEDFRNLLRQWSTEIERVLRPGGSFAIFCADEYVSDLIWSLRDAGLKPRRTITWRKPNAVPINRAHMMMSACEYIVYGVKGKKAVFNADIERGSEPVLDGVERTFVADKAGSVLHLKLLALLDRRQVDPNSEEFSKLLETAFEEARFETARRIAKVYKGTNPARLSIPNLVTFNSASGGRLHPTEKPVPLLEFLVQLLSREGDLVLDPFSGSGSTMAACVNTGRSCLSIEVDDEYFQGSANRIARLVELKSQTQFELR